MINTVLQLIITTLYTYCFLLLFSYFNLTAKFAHYANTKLLAPISMTCK